MFRSTDVGSVPASVPAEKDQGTKPSLRRRGFLLGLGATGAGVAALALKPVVPQSEEKPEATEPSGYRDTAHIQNYYRTAKV
jgi:hypothetical protein